MMFGDGSVACDSNAQVAYSMSNFNRVLIMETLYITSRFTDDDLIFFGSRTLRKNNISLSHTLTHTHPL